MEGRGGAIKIDYFIKLSSGFGVVDSPKERGRSLVSQTRSSDIMAALPRSSSQICSYYAAGDAVGSRGAIFLTRERETKAKEEWMEGKGETEGLIRGCSQRTKPEKPWDNEIMGSVSLPTLPANIQ